MQTRVRRSVDDLSALDLARLRRAFAQSMAASDDRGYQYWARLYWRPTRPPAQVSGPLFLPWNRAYLARFERALQVFESGVTIPWWDWTSERAEQFGLPEAYASPTLDGQSNPLYSAPIELPSSSEAPPQGLPAASFRNLGQPGTSLPSTQALRRVLQVEGFPDFSRQLNDLHNQVHVWLGGTNAEVRTGAYDPIFWALQASVDRVWWLWQHAHPDSQPTGTFGDQVLTPFMDVVSDVWDVITLGYEYAESSPMASRLLAGAECDQPATTDELNFTDYAKAFAEIIASTESTPPLTIGIYGSWGMGKSTLLKLIAGEFPDSEKRKAIRGWVFRRRAQASAESGPDAELADVHVVEFNAWEYSSSDTIWPSLVRHIMEKMEEVADWGFWTRFRRTLKRNIRHNWQQNRNQIVVASAILVPLGVVAAWKLGFSAPLILTIVAGLGIPGLIKLGADALSNPVSRWVGSLVREADYGGELPHMREIREDLEFLVARLEDRERSREEGRRHSRQSDGPAANRSAELPTSAADATRSKSRILVMIDDLDRCEPEKAVEVLQAINLLLNFEVFIVCLGIDARVITAAVEAHYKQLLGSAGASGYEYLDKIVQIPFRIPVASTAEINNFLKSVMPVAEWNVDGLPGEPAAAAPEQLSGEPNGGYGTTPQSPEDTPQPAEPSSKPAERRQKFQPEEVAAFRQIAPLLRRNPRHMKRLINVYRMVRTLAILRGASVITENSDLAIRWIVICAQWPYTVSAMLARFETIGDATTRQLQPGTSALTELYREVQDSLSSELQRQLDGDRDGLTKLLSETTMTWEQLREIQPFTLNFNPAIETALHASLAEMGDSRRMSGASASVPESRAGEDALLGNGGAPGSNAANT